SVDAATLKKKRVVLTTKLDRIVSFDRTTGVLDAEPGVTIGDLACLFAGARGGEAGGGWFPGVVPGTRFVTLGGAVAADIHGKNHHRDGSFSSCVDSITLRLPSGESLECSRTERRGLFGATVGGMGLTGMIERVRMRMRPVSSSWIRTR
ncbi:MAG: FAD-binding oxidoreductase, partial [Actinobacteria bacterium]|nr:FAD-binding oxidoreductase [Actinomycetota bacterium]